MLKEGYNRFYRERHFGSINKPSFIVSKIKNYLTEGLVLDLGCGDGKNALYLAREGFLVTAADFAKEGILSLEKSAKANDLRITTVLADVNHLKIKENYDCVLIILLLHNLSQVQALELIKNTKLHTKEGGINIIECITKESDFYEAHHDRGHFYGNQNDLIKLYSGWEVLESDSRSWDAREKTRDGMTMWNTSDAIIFRKPK